jgi:ascorbate-specific PTS system EIIC-type component UlaA
MNKITFDIGEKFLGGSKFLTETKDVGKLVSIIVSNAIIVAGVIMLFLFVGGGIAMIVGAGKNNPEQAGKGKQAVTAAVIGFVIIFAAYWIVQLIGKITGINILGI